MKKPIFAVVAAFLLVSSMSAAPQIPLEKLGPLAEAIWIKLQGNMVKVWKVATKIEQDMCKKTSGLVHKITHGRQPELVCECPKGLQLYRDYGCVKPGSGSLPQTNQPVKRLN